MKTYSFRSLVALRRRDMRARLVPTVCVADVPRDARSALRHWHTPAVTYNDVGCRPARMITR